MPASTREIYLLSSKELSPETIAVAFAKTSRFPDSFRDIAAQLTDEKSAQFHEKWVVGYGHASVAEHAVLHLAIENASRIAMEAIESNRLASYTEKSTRYQKWNRDAFYIPTELDDHPLRDEYIETNRLLFDTYAASLEPVKAVIQKRVARRDNESDEAFDRRVRSQYVDVSRFILPASALANVGVTANGRVLENSIRKMRSHPLAEIRQIGEEIKAAALREIPTLVKYAEPVEYIMETSKTLSALTPSPLPLGEGQRVRDWCNLISYDEDGEQRILAAALYRFGEMSYAQALDYVASLTKPEFDSLADALLGRLGRHDIPLRELEHATYTFDLIMDQGAYAEFKRHRMMSQTPQLLTCCLGYVTPQRIVEAGFETEYRKAMDAAAALYEKLYALNPNVAQYGVPNAFSRRVLATFNLREAFHFCSLRAAANAHFSIRKVAQRVAEEIRCVHPRLSKYMSLHTETWQGIEEEYFAS